MHFLLSSDSRLTSRLLCQLSRVLAFVVFAQYLEVNV
jgi:hypothetical protein